MMEMYRWFGGLLNRVGVFELKQIAANEIEVFSYASLSDIEINFLISFVYFSETSVLFKIGNLQRNQLAIDLKKLNPWYIKNRYYSKGAMLSGWRPFLRERVVLGSEHINIIAHFLSYREFILLSSDSRSLELFGCSKGESFTCNNPFDIDRKHTVCR